MDKHTPDILPSVELPNPLSPEQIPEVGSRADVYSEQVSSRQLEQVAKSAAPGPVNVQQAAQSQPLPNPFNAPAGGMNGVTASPQIADDTDLIEKEWVERAKRIVEHTKHDPHLQTQEMHTMKADYIKKRYNKDIKLSD